MAQFVKISHEVTSTNSVAQEMYNIHSTDYKQMYCQPSFCGLEDSYHAIMIAKDINQG